MIVLALSLLAYALVLVLLGAMMGFSPALYMIAARLSVSSRREQRRQVGVLAAGVITGIVMLFAVGGDSVN